MSEGSSAHDSLGLLTPNRYLASAFVDARAINTNGSTIGGMLIALRDDRFLPTTVQEVGPSGAVTRMAFATHDESALLVLHAGRFDFAHLYPEGQTAQDPDFSAFCSE